MPNIARRATQYVTRADVVLALVLAVPAAIQTINRGGDRVALGTTLAVITVLALAFRRRAPALSILIVSVGLASETLLTESPDQMAVLLAVVVSAYSAPAYADRRGALMGLCLLCMAIALSIALDPSDEVANILPTLALFVAVPAGLGFAFHRRGQDLASLERRAEKAEREAQAAIQAERQRIARELHDVVSHAVTLIAVQAEAGQATIDRNPEAARRSLAAIGSASRDALAELHSLLTLLGESDDASAQHHGLEALPTLIGGVRAAGLRLNVTETGERPALAEEIDACAFRVVQEALTNAMRHTREPVAALNLDYEPDQVRIEVESSGLAHQSAYGGSGRGLIGLRDRVRELGGSLDAGPAEDGRYSVLAVLPLDAA